jgi:hypothetical protein
LTWQGANPELATALADAPCHPLDLHCTVDEMNTMSPLARLAWLKAFQAIYSTGGYFNALEDFIENFSRRGHLAPDRWIGQVDAVILTAAQDGLAMYQRVQSSSQVGGSGEFFNFFIELFERNASQDQLTRSHILAEQAAIEAGKEWATAPPTHEERFILGGADAWRSVGRMLVETGVADRYGVGELADRIFTPRSRAVPKAVGHYQDALRIGALVSTGDQVNCHLRMQQAPTLGSVLACFASSFQ